MRGFRDGLICSAESVSPRTSTDFGVVVASCVFSKKPFGSKTYGRHHEEEDDSGSTSATEISLTPRVSLAETTAFSGARKAESEAAGSRLDDRAWSSRERCRGRLDPPLADETSTLDGPGSSGEGKAGCTPVVKRGETNAEPMDDSMKVVAMDDSEASRLEVGKHCELWKVSCPSSQCSMS